MICLRIKKTKEFMQKFLTTEAFADFLLVEAVITTSVTYTIDGHVRKEFYTKEEQEERKLPPFAEWETMRPQVLQMIKGKHTPLLMKLLLAYKAEKELLSAHNPEREKELLLARNPERGKELLSVHNPEREKNLPLAYKAEKGKRLLTDGAERTDVAARADVSGALLKEKAGETDASGSMSFIKNLLCTVKYENGRIILTGGVSYQGFTLDKEPEKQWDMALCRLLDEMGLEYEIV